MEWSVIVKKELSFSLLEIGAAWVGKDLLLCINGGSRPHIGSAVRSQPRPSLTGDGTISATPSVMNLTGHKDEFICRKIGENLCRSLNTTVICTGGFHVDGITREQIREVTDAADALARELKGKLWCPILR